MADMLNIPSLGKLEIVETYAYYDQPVLFSCKNATGHLYLVVAADENDQYDTWLYAGVSPERLNHIRSGEIDLHDAFADPEAGILFQVTAPYDNQSPLLIEPVESNQIPEDMLPVPGERLNLKIEIPLARSNSKEISKAFEDGIEELLLVNAGSKQAELERALYIKSFQLFSEFIIDLVPLDLSESQIQAAIDSFKKSQEEMLSTFKKLAAR